MMQFPLPDGGVLAVIEPGNLERLKSGCPLLVGDVAICFTPDIVRFAQMLGVSANTGKGQREEFQVHLTPEQLDSALKACQKLPEVFR